jgi:HEAT repeat protein
MPLKITLNCGIIMGLFRYKMSSLKLSQIFNIKGNEWSRIFLASTTRFLYRVGFVIGWTMLLAMFVGNYGIAALPYLFVLSAIFTIIGSVLFAAFLDRLSKTLLMLISIFCAGLSLMWSTFFVDSNVFVFFAFLIVSVGTFLVQFKIILNSYVEEMFTSLESERTFPVIEAAETFGGIVGGILVTLFANAFEVYQFVYLWVGALALIVPLIFLYDRSSGRKLALLEKKTGKHLGIGVFTKFKQVFKEPRLAPFVRGLIMIVILQWFLVTLMEFQYTGAVFANVKDVILDSGGGFEHAFVHDLGILFIIFSSSTLLMQLFLGGRFISYLGVIGAMLLHPVVSLLSLFPFTYFGTYFSAVLAKNNFVMTTVIHTNAYHTSYYAIREDYREYVREFLEGFVRPLGAIFATFVLFGFTFFLEGRELFFVLNLVMVLAAGLMIFITARERRNYTSSVLGDLKGKVDNRRKLNAIDILGQAGHENSTLHLLSLLGDARQPISLKVKILRTLGEMKDLQAVGDVIKFLKVGDSWLQEAALDTLNEYADLHSEAKTLVFTQDNLFDALKDFILKSKNEDLLSKALLLMSSMSNISTVEFLLSQLKVVKGRRKLEIILALGRYGDAVIADFLRPYLDSARVEVQIHAAISLGGYKGFSEEVSHLVYSFYYSNVPKKVAYSLFAMSELGLKNARKLCLNHLDSEDLFVRMHAALALAKLGYAGSVNVLIDLLFSRNRKIAQEALLLLRNIDPTVKTKLNSIIRKVVSHKLEEMLSVEDGVPDLKNVEKKDLLILQYLYALIGSYDEVYLISNLTKT